MPTVMVRALQCSKCGYTWLRKRASESDTTQRHLHSWLPSVSTAKVQYSSQPQQAPVVAAALFPMETASSAWRRQPSKRSFGFQRGAPTLGTVRPCACSPAGRYKGIIK